MKPLGLVSQIFAMLLAIAIAFLFVRPTFNEIGQLQTDLQNYTNERQRVTEINQTLANKVAILESVSQNDIERITTYIPSFLDEVKVLRDLQSIADNAGVIFSAIKFDGKFSTNANNDQVVNVQPSEVVPYSFTVSVEGNYSNIKTFLSFLEQNEYPLQVYGAALASTEGDFMMLEATIITYVDEKEVLDNSVSYE